MWQRSPLAVEVTRATSFSPEEATVGAPIIPLTIAITSITPFRPHFTDAIAIVTTTTANTPFLLYNNSTSAPAVPSITGPFTITVAMASPTLVDITATTNYATFHTTTATFFAITTVTDYATSLATSLTFFAITTVTNYATSLATTATFFAITTVTIYATSLATTATFFAITTVTNYTTSLATTTTFRAIATNIVTTMSSVVLSPMTTVTFSATSSRTIVTFLAVTVILTNSTIISSFGMFTGELF